MMMYKLLAELCKMLIPDDAHFSFALFSWSIFMQQINTSIVKITQ